MKKVYTLYEMIEALANDEDLVFAPEESGWTGEIVMRDGIMCWKVFNETKLIYDIDYFVIVSDNEGYANTIDTKYVLVDEVKSYEN